MFLFEYLYDCAITVSNVFEVFCNPCFEVTNFYWFFLARV